MCDIFVKGLQCVICDMCGICRRRFLQLCVTIRYLAGTTS